MDQMRRIEDAMATPGVAVCHEKGMHGDWIYDVYDSAFEAGKLQVNAFSLEETRHETVTNLTAARAWLATLPA